MLVLFVYWLRGRKNLSKPRICILVLGDIGRSPRMQYHALSCAKAGYHVDLVGFGGSWMILAIIISEQSTGGGGRRRRSGVVFMLHLFRSISILWGSIFLRSVKLLIWVPYCIQQHYVKYMQLLQCIHIFFGSRCEN